MADCCMHDEFLYRKNLINEINSKLKIDHVRLNIFHPSQLASPLKCLLFLVVFAISGIVGWAQSEIPKGEQENAFKEYDEAIRLNPKDADAYFKRGNAKLQSGDLDGAIKDYGEVIRLDPKNADTYFNRGVAKSAKGELDSAIKDFDEAIRLNPKDPAAYFSRGIANKNKGELDSAIKDFGEAIRLDPNDAAAYHNRAFVKYKKGDFDSAIKDSDEAIRLDPKDAHYHFIRGIVKATKDEYDSAIKDYDEAIRLDPTHNAAYMGRGWMNHICGNYATAIRDYETAKRLDPKILTPICNLSFLRSTCPDASLRDEKAALSLADEALKLDPKDSHALDAKACALALSGNFSQAIKHAELALKNPAFSKGSTITGGVMAKERIAAWQKKELWFSKPTK